MHYQVNKKHEIKGTITFNLIYSFEEKIILLKRKSKFSYKRIYLKICKLNVII